MISQSAYAVAAWLVLPTGRRLRLSDLLDDDKELVPPFAPSVLTRIADLLAWTRSDQVYLRWENAADDPKPGNLPAAARELRAIHQEFTT
ncbi:hypothetical protein [Streptomyces sp. 8K308]|uniref:hypothetical protein n=1 Tax=Streptomyces sp. 8K308 TaxID=2530388 RepID=UPI001A9DBB12|nr:hypothetical protein [Streptomyces sp. 8K308]